MTMTANARPSLDDLPEILTPEQAASWLSMGRNAMYQALKSGGIPARKIGARYFIARENLRLFVLGPVPFEEGGPR